MAFSVPSGCVRFERYCGKVYSIAFFSMPVGCVPFAGYCGKVCSLWLSLCLVAALGLKGIVVKCTV